MQTWADVNTPHIMFAVVYRTIFPLGKISSSSRRQPSRLAMMGTPIRSHMCPGPLGWHRHWPWDAITTTYWHQKKRLVLDPSIEGES